MLQVYGQKWPWDQVKKSQPGPHCVRHEALPEPVAEKEMNHPVSSMGEQGHRGGGDLSFHFKCASLGSRDLEAVEECVPEDTVFGLSMKWKNTPPTWSLPSQPQSNPTFPLHLNRKWATHSVCCRVFSPEAHFQVSFNNRKRLQWPETWKHRWTMGRNDLTFCLTLKFSLQINGRGPQFSSYKTKPFSFITSFGGGQLRLMRCL